MRTSTLRWVYLVFRRLIKFLGIGSDEIIALGEFQTELTVDGHSYPILIRVVSDTISRQKLLIGADFLDTVKVNVRQSAIKINPIRKPAANENNSLSDVFRIDVENVYEANAIDMSYIWDTEHRRTIETLIENYKPNKTLETEIKNDNSFKRR